jgi:23S rRNA (uracil1939-C5)-methyltransferase
LLHPAGTGKVRPQENPLSLNTSRPTTSPSPCPHFPDCVACAFSGLAYGEQLERKRRRVAEALAKYDSLAGLEVPPLVKSPRAFGYRNQAKLVVRETQRGVLLGVYRPGTHQVVDIIDCPVHEPRIRGVLKAVRLQVERLNVPVYDERSARGWLRYVVLRSSTWKKSVQVILVVRDRAFRGERALTRTLARLRGVASVVVNVNPAAGNVIFGDTFAPVTPDDALFERIGGLKLRSRAGGFLQANIPVARRIYDRVLEWADPGEHDVAVDLYGGVGAISFYLATRSACVYGIEESPVAVLDAKANTRLNGFHNVRFLAGDAGPTLRELAERVGQIDVLTLNPPRKGADSATREAIVAVAPSRIVYVSCNPESLARDLDWLAKYGYATNAMQPFDMLPQTDHVECVARLEKTKPARES